MYPDVCAFQNLEILVSRLALDNMEAKFSAVSFSVIPTYNNRIILCAVRTAFDNDQLQLIKAYYVMNGMTIQYQNLQISCLLLRTYSL